MLPGLTFLSSWDPMRVAASDAAISLALRRCRGGSAGFDALASDNESAKSRPVSMEHVCRTKRDRQSMTRETLAGRECQESIRVPVTRMNRFEVIMYSGGNVSRYHTGVRSRMRMRSTVSAGRVVALVAVRCMDKKSVRRRKGSRRILQRDVNSFIVSTISSKLL